MEREWETTIEVRISEADWGAILKQTDVYNEDVIFHFENGQRLKERRLQRKEVGTRKNLLGFHEKQCFPITRTQAIEHGVDVKNSASSNTVVCAVHRLLRVEDQPSVEFECSETYGRVRVAYDKEESDNGVRCFQRFEIEYPPDSPYKKILQCERALMEFASSYGCRPISDRPDAKEMFSYIMSKVQMWHCFNCKLPYKWAYKWNGIKSRLIFTNNDKCEQVAYLWPDTQRIRIERVHGSTNMSSLFSGMYMLAEIMLDRIVIIEVIGCRYYGRIFTTEPMTNVNMLACLSEELGKCMVGELPVWVQTFYPAPMPTIDYDKTLHDGFVVVQNDMIIKWKIPTVDVRFVGVPNRFSIGSDTVIHLTTVPNVPLELNAIYEISCDYHVLRRRTDRIAPSTDHEYAVFLKSIELLHRSQDDL